MKTLASFAVFRAVALYGALFFANFVVSLSPISIKGTKLYDQDGKQFFVRGVIYMGVDESDVLVDSSQCQLDAGVMRNLGVNTIRVYGADSTKDHDGCMQAFASQGIYVWLDLATTSKKIEPKSPAWTMELYSNWTSTLDQFAGYDNLLAFTIATDGLDNTTKGSVAAIAIKSAVRDIKAFRDARGYRQIPITFAAASAEPHLSLSGQFFACGDSSTTVEMFGINNFDWCGNTTSTSSGLDHVYESFKDYNIPLVFSETGCNERGYRDFIEFETMLGPVFESKFSGVIVYEWAQQANNYGLVKYSNTAQTGTPSLMDDYSTLSTVFLTMNPTGTPMSIYKPTESAPACPTSNIASSWALKADINLPTIVGLDLGTVTARTTILTSTGSSSSASSASSTGSTSPGESGGQDGKESALSRGSLIGIIVGCILAALVLLGIAVFFFIRKRKAQEIQELDRTPFASPKDAGELQGDHVNYYSMGRIPPEHKVSREKVELPANSIQELDASQQSSDHTTAYSEASDSPQYDSNTLYNINGFSNTQAVYELPGPHSIPSASVQTQ